MRERWIDPSIAVLGSTKNAWWVVARGSARVGDLGVDRAATNRRAAESSDDMVRGGLRHFDERVGIEEVDRADLLAGDARLVRDRADKVARPHAILPADIDEEPRHARFRARAVTGHRMI